MAETDAGSASPDPVSLPWRAGSSSSGQIYVESLKASPGQNRSPSVSVREVDEG